MHVEKGIMKTIFNFSIIALIWSIYYLAKRITGNILTNVDIAVCGSVIVFCVSSIVYYIYKHLSGRKDD